MQTIEVIKTATTWKQFQADNASLTVKELQDSWSQLNRERQAEMKERYEAATGQVTFRTTGRIAVKGNAKRGIVAGTLQLAAIKRVTATKREIERQRHADAKRAAKTDSGYAQLLAEAAE